jgi:copper chaperone CopZ
MAQILNVKIAGMHCERCIAAVETALRQLDGVRDCTVRIGEARITYDEQATRKQEVFSAIRSAGAYDITGFDTNG